MNNLEKYQQEINTIYSCLEKLSNTWTSQDNINYINNINEYKEDAISFANSIKEIILAKEKSDKQNDK